MSVNTGTHHLSATSSPGHAHEFKHHHPTSRERFLDACHCRPTDKTPIWMMRQAGRCLPEYRALKEKYSFLDLVRTPDLATEVTLQPIRRFGFDAAILFSDILVIPEAMGQGYCFRDTGGIQMDFTIRDAADIDKLVTNAVAERLDYVPKALRLIKEQLAGKTALIGFTGSPWTLANFMLEGGSSHHPHKALEMLQNQPALFRKLMEKLCEAIIAYVELQVRAGAEVIQLFDTLGSLLPNEQFLPGSGEWLRRIVESIDESVPVIVFSKGTRDWDTLLNLGADVLGTDPELDIAEARRMFPADLAIQGNLAPECLSAMTPEQAGARAVEILEKMKGRPGHIFNLGHGVPPDASLDNMAAVIQAVRRFGCHCDKPCGCQS